MKIQIVLLSALLISSTAFGWVRSIGWPQGCSSDASRWDATLKKIAGEKDKVYVALDCNLGLGGDPETRFAILDLTNNNFILSEQEPQLGDSVDMFHGWTMYQTHAEKYLNSRVNIQITSTPYFDSSFWPSGYDYVVRDTKRGLEISMNKDRILSAYFYNDEIVLLMWRSTGYGSAETYILNGKLTDFLANRF